MTQPPNSNSTANDEERERIAKIFIAAMYGTDKAWGTFDQREMDCMYRGADAILAAGFRLIPASTAGRSPAPRTAAGGPDVMSAPDDPAELNEQTRQVVSLPSDALTFMEAMGKALEPFAEVTAACDPLTEDDRDIARDVLAAFRAWRALSCEHERKLDASPPIRD